MGKRGKEPKKRGKPVEGSLKWFENEWMRAFLATPKSGEQLPHIKMLAQLSYENMRIRKRLETAESLLFTLSTGMVLGRDGNPHLMGCSIREGEGHACDCGSKPKDAKKGADDDGEQEGGGAGGRG